MSIAAVVSDFGGVLTTPLMASFARLEGPPGVGLADFGAAMARAAERDGEHPLFALERGEIAEREFLSRVERALEERLGRRVPLEPLGARLMGALEPNEALLACYRRLRARGVRLALCTNNVREWEPHWRAMLPIDELFEVVVDSAVVGTRKPEPRIYAITLERLGLPGPACAFVDDLEANVEAARAAGMHGVHFRDTAQAVAELEALLG